MTDLLLGIDLGGTHVRTALVTRDKEVLRSDSRATHDAFDVPAKRVQILTATLGQDAGVLGAAGVALERSEDA